MTIGGTPHFFRGNMLHQSRDTMLETKEKHICYNFGSRLQQHCWQNMECCRSATSKIKNSILAIYSYLARQLRRSLFTIYVVFDNIVLNIFNYCVVYDFYSLFKVRRSDSMLRIARVTIVFDGWFIIPIRCHRSVLLIRYLQYIALNIIIFSN